MERTQQWRKREMTGEAKFASQTKPIEIEREDWLELTRIDQKRERERKGWLGIIRSRCPPGSLFVSFRGRRLGWRWGRGRGCWGGDAGVFGPIWEEACLADLLRFLVKSGMQRVEIERVNSLWLCPGGAPVSSRFAPDSGRFPANSRWFSARCKSDLYSAIFFCRYLAL